MKKKKLFAVAAVVVTAAAGCGSSSSSSSGSGSGSGGSKAITVGVLTDVTGLGASGNKTCVQGVAAGAKQAAKDGYTVHYIVGDTATSPTTALTAAQKLVEQNHVTAVIGCSSVTFAAAQYLEQQKVPVVGEAEDAGEWRTDPNMFAVAGATDFTAVNSAYGKFFKMEGADTIGTVGYSISPSSADAAKATALSAKAAGLKVPYVNANFPFGSTNVQPIALAMKNDGVTGFTSETDPNTSFALITALRNDGDNLKVALLPDGYGGDLTQAGPGAIQAGQGVYFSLAYEPVEMQTAATKQFQADLAAVGVTGLPTFAEYNGYGSVALLEAGMKIAGGKVTQSTLMSGLDKVTNFTAYGLLGNSAITPADRTGTPIGPGGCLYMTKLNGSSFQLVPGADPICGTVLSAKA